MESNGWGRRGRTLAWGLASLIAIGCDGGEGRALRVAEVIVLDDDAASTLSVDPSGRMWLGQEGGLRIREAGALLDSLVWPGRATPRVLAWLGDTAYVTLGDSLLVLAAGEDSADVARGGFGENPVLLDVRGRAVLQGAASGAVLGHDPATLEPRWAWAALATPTTALAISPHGDRVYQAVGGEGGPPRLLIRDLQTGRSLASEAFPSTFDALAADSTGRLYGVAREGRRAAIVALEPRGAELRLLWRVVLPMAEAGADVRLRVEAGRLVVWGLGPRVGLRLLDTADGAVLGRTRTDPQDVAFGAEGGLWALYPGELRRLE